MISFFPSKMLLNHPINIIRHVINQKIHVKVWGFDMKYNINYEK
jgi:hypothetical protein